MSTPLQPTAPEPSRLDPPASASGQTFRFGAIFEDAPQHRLKRAAGATVGSIVAHVLLVAIGIYLLTLPRSVQPVEPRELPIGQLVYLEATPGPGGGGGGSPEPAPPQPIEIPKTELPKPEPVPVTPPPVPVAPPPPPSLSVPVMTASANTAQASGTVELSAGGGGGRGTGIGSGSGRGVGEGSGQGIGGGVYRPGAGINNPVPLRQVKPAYTAEAMRAKIQGSVSMEVVILEDGSVGDVRVTRSLDRVYGLDQEAIKAARQWVFRPATDRSGKPVPIAVTLVLDFNMY